MRYKTLKMNIKTKKYNLNKYMTAILTVIFLSLAGLCYPAPANFKVSYQGFLKQSGSPVNTTKGFIFKIRDGSGGAIQWQSACTDIMVSTGVFRVALSTDINGGIGDWDTINWNGIDAYLEVIVGDEGTCGNAASMSPQERLMAVPYSMLSSSTIHLINQVDSSQLSSDKDSLFKVSGGSVSVNSQGQIIFGTTTAISDSNLNVATGKVQEGGNALISAGTIIFYDGTSCPSGWSEYTAARGRFIVGVPDGGTLEGTAAGSPLTDLQSTGLIHKHTADPASAATSSVGSNNVSTSGGDCPNIIINSHSHTIDLAATASTNNGDNLPYIQLLICQKN